MKKLLAVVAAPVVAASLAAGFSSTAHAVDAPAIDPEYTPVTSSFARVQSDPAFRSEYHYAPQFQPVENQCANVGHGNWARVNCWTDDGDNLLVRVEFVHPRVKPTMVRVKNDTAHTVTGGQQMGRTKQFEIPETQRTAAGNPYIIFNLEYFEGQDFWIEAFAQTSQSQWAWSDFTVSVNQNVNRASDSEPVVARQATVYDSNFYKLSQPLQFEKIVEVDGKYKAVYSMVNANEAEAELVDQIQIWPVDAASYTWRPEAQDGDWANYVQVPQRAMGCDASNTDVPRLGYNGLGADTGFITYTKDSADYPLIREGAKTSIMVDIQPGWERIQYETWMNGCANPFGRPGQMRPYQGQATLPPFAVLDVKKVLGGDGSEAAKGVEFGGTITYPAGSVSEVYSDPSGWAGLDWTGNRTWDYAAKTFNWAAEGDGTPWRSPLLPAEASVTVSETVVPAVENASWEQLLPGEVKLGSAQLADLLDQIGEERSATAGDLVANASCLTTAQLQQTAKAAASSVDGDGLRIAEATVANNLAKQVCPEVPPQPPVIDECGVDNARWELPADTDEFDWEINAAGELVVTAKGNLVFANGEKSHNYGVAPDSGEACPPGILPVPAMPDPLDECGPANAEWQLPANTAEVTWSVNEQGELIATAATGFVFEGGEATHNYGVAPDSGEACPPVEPPVTPEEPPTKPVKPVVPTPEQPDAPTPPTPVLANTGAQITGMVVGAGVLLLLGVGVVLFAKRKRKSDAAEQ